MSKTCQDYTDDVFMPYIVQQLNNVHRLDVVWDLYISENFKASTWQKRGHGQRWMVSPSAPIFFRLEMIYEMIETSRILLPFLQKELTNERCLANRL